MSEFLFRILNIILWFCFFAIGASPEDVFLGLRALSGTTVWKALVNSPWLITFALTGYYMHFIYHRCVEARMARTESFLKAVQIGLMAFLAFLPLRPDFNLYKNVLHQESQKVIYMILTMKVFFWLFLLFIVVFYYLNGNRFFYKLPDVFIDFYPKRFRPATDSNPNQKNQTDTTS